MLFEKNYICIAEIMAAYDYLILVWKKKIYINSTTFPQTILVSTAFMYILNDCSVYTQLVSLWSMYYILIFLVSSCLLEMTAYVFHILYHLLNLEEWGVL